MGSNEHTKLSDSSNPAYRQTVQHILDIKDEPENHLDTSKCNIYRVPCSIRNSNKELDPYTPQLVSIGPFHYGEKKLKPMQTHKLRYHDLFQERLNKKSNNAEAMKTFKEFIEIKEQAIRQCYAGKLCDDDDIGKDKLVAMMFLDSIFIMELFLRIQARKLKSDENAYSDDVIVIQTWLNKCIQRDLLLIENQIPLFILEELYDVVPKSDKMRPTFLELAYDYFECFHANIKYDSSDNQETAACSDFSNCQPSSKNCSVSVPGSENEPSPGFLQVEKNRGKKPEHFTDLVRSFYICKGLKTRGKKGYLLKTATKLRESGVSFVKVIDINRPLIDIRFEKVRPLSWFLCLGCFPKSTYFKARLEIPQLKVDDTTECVLRNLIAFEQCHYPNEPYICNYVSFIDSLIHTKDDVELLVEKEVIVHELGSDKEVATLVNSLCKHVVADKTCYLEIINKLNKHEKRQWNRTMAALRFVYFRDTWRASSTVVATAVLVFTIFNFCRVVRLVLDLERRGEA